MALFIMMLVPLTQLTQPSRERVDTLEAVDLAVPPPPPRLEEPPPPPQMEEKEPPPELKQPPPMPTLEQLEVALNPGTGGDMSLDIGLGVDLTTESTDQLEKLFGFGELDEVPHLVREGRFRYPPNSPRGRGEALVRLLIYVEADGRISVQRVIDYSHQEFIEAARRMAEGSRFSPPMRNGQAVRSKYEWPIRIPLR
ncbi:energy transducer TonB [Coraliomargarita algicola]|uniref:Energy transducer TonB n=1 Tax=Coraliomargarita algicola TaxID=3092156 RepID=A0ABZ0RH14_9BACT|nr:energy transducer TonB [Coraliomargarita sp. J2-16]WPJ94491.1 energy transducer TonB [Coraliomargarita sp. J2-16]